LKLQHVFKFFCCRAKQAKFSNLC